MENVSKTITLGNQTSCLNQIQINSARDFLSTTYGIFCGSGSDDQKGCNKTPKELEILWSAKFLERGEKVPQRKKPYLLVNEKNGYGLHRLHNGEVEYFGNVCYYCYSCNQLYDTNSKVTAESKNYESKKSKEVRPVFPEDLKNHLSKFGDICMKGCVNKWSRLDRFSCSQQLLNNIIDQMIDIDIELVDRQEFGLECMYSKCNGEHIILLGRPPIPKKNDYQVMKNEEDTDKDE